MLIALVVVLIAFAAVAIVAVFVDAQQIRREREVGSIVWSRDHQIAHIGAAMRMEMRDLNDSDRAAVDDMLASLGGIHDVGGSVPLLDIGDDLGPCALPRPPHPHPHPAVRDTQQFCRW